MGIRFGIFYAILIALIISCNQDVVSKEEWIENLKLKSHPEGGYFTQSYKAKGIIYHNDLPRHYNGDRSYSTGIYFMLTTHNFSAFHVLKSDEMWHHYYGAPLHVHVLHPNGEYELLTIGKNPSGNIFPQAVVPAGSYFASEVIDDSNFDYSLVGCTVSPGFEFEDFELSSSGELITKYPEHKELIERLTRQ